MHTCSHPHHLMHRNGKSHFEITCLLRNGDGIARKWMTVGTAFSIISPQANTTIKNLHAIRHFPTFKHRKCAINSLPPSSVTEKKPNDETRLIGSGSQDYQMTSLTVWEAFQLHHIHLLLQQASKTLQEFEAIGKQLVQYGEVLR